MRNHSSIWWLIPPRGWQMSKDDNQRVKILWFLPNIVIYEPKPRGVYELAVPAGGQFRKVQSFPQQRERSEKHWGKTFVGTEPPVSVMEYNSITITQWEGGS